MRVAIWGCRDGKYLYEQIKLNGRERYHVCYFGDNDPQYFGNKIAEIPVVDISTIVKKYKMCEIEAVIVTARKGYSRYCITEQLKEAGIGNIILVKPSPLTYHMPIAFESKQENYYRHWMIMNEQKKPVIHHLEAHVADGCNLNCRGCLHFANLHGREELPDLLKVLEDVKKVSNECEIFQFRALGGEPLLNPELASFLEKLRMILPNTDIAVISNGILIPQMPEKLFEVMRENEIGFNLTLYPPTLKMKEKIYDTLNKYHVMYGSHEVKTDKFEKYMMLKPSKVNTYAYKYCVSRGILTLRDGKIYKCPIVAYVNRYFDTFKIQQHCEEGIDIYDTHLDWKKTVENLSLHEMNFCRHCSKISEQFLWNNGKPEYTDWLVGEEKICDDK